MSNIRSHETPRKTGQANEFCRLRQDRLLTVSSRRGASRDGKTERFQRHQEEMPPTGNIVGVDDDLLAAAQRATQHLPIEAKIRQFHCAVDVLHSSEERGLPCFRQRNCLLFCRLSFADDLLALRLLLAFAQESHGGRVIDPSVAGLHRFRHGMIGRHHFLRRMQVVQRDAIQRDTKPPGPYSSQRRRRRSSTAPVKTARSVVSRSAECFGRRTRSRSTASAATAQHTRRVSDLEQIDTRIGDTITHRRLQFDEVAVASHHDGLVGDAAHTVVAVRT